MTDRDCSGEWRQVAILTKLCYSLWNLRRLIIIVYGPTLGVSTLYTVSYYIHMLSKRVKQNTLKNTQRHEGDTGSAEAQVGLLTRQIEELSKHLRKHKKDFHSRRGLLQMVADRRKHLKYLQKKDEKAYEALIKKLGLKR